MSLPIHNMMPKLTTSRAPRPHQSRLVICTLFGSMTRSPRTVGAIFTSRGRRHVDLNQAGGCRSRRPATFDADLLARYDRPGPRYTSYPTAPQFADGFGEEQLRTAVLASNGDPIPRRLSLYVHVPFCLSPCFYCGCNRIITRDKSRAGTYLARLYREIGLMAELFERDREVIQVHLGEIGRASCRERVCQYV